jgi:hypothetical protein
MLLHLLGNYLVPLQPRGSDIYFNHTFIYYTLLLRVMEPNTPLNHLSSPSTCIMIFVQFCHADCFLPPPFHRQPCIKAIPVFNAGNGDGAWSCKPTMSRALSYSRGL